MLLLTKKNISVILLLICSNLFAQIIPFPDFGDTNLAREKYFSGDFITARRLYVQEILQNPSNYEASYVLGRIASFNFDWKKAAEYYSHSIKDNPNNVQCVIFYAQALEGIIENGSTFKVLKAAKELKNLISDAHDRFPEEQEVMQIEILFNINAPKIIGGNKQYAKKQINILNRLNPGLAMRLSGILAASENEYKLVNEMFLKSSEYAFARLYLDWGNWLVEMNRGDEAVKNIIGNLNNTDNPLLMLYLLGRFSAETGNYLDEGLEALNDYLEFPWSPILPTIPEALYQKALIYIQLDNKVGAKNALEECLKIRPDLHRAQELQNYLNRASVE